MKIKKEKRFRTAAVVSALLLFLIIAGCCCCDFIITKDPTYLDLRNYNTPPCREFLFGTDSMGRDIFSMIWYGGRVSLQIGIYAALFSALFAVLYGAPSAFAPAWADALLMRLAEILQSIPGFLPVILLQAVLGEASVYSLSFVIGVTGWMSLAKIVRAQVRQLRSCEYVLAAECMGGSFFYVLRTHLLVPVLSAILFPAVMNIRAAMMTEAALSFLGIGLPVDAVSWGSMLSLSENALLGGSWWVIVFPGIFLTVTMICVTELVDALREHSIDKKR